MAVFTWDGGEHAFELRIGQLRALQAATEVGPLFLLGRMTGAQWFVDDVVETIRLGLIGGGMDDVAAKKLTDKVFNENSTALYKHVLLATRILRDAVMGVPDDVVGDDDSGENQAGKETNSAE